MQFTKKHLFLVLALFCALPVFSQEKEKIVKLSYTLFRGDNADVPTITTNPVERDQFLYDFSVAYLLKNISKLQYHEFALSRVFAKNTEVGVGDAKDYLFAVKYEYGWIGAKLNEILEFRYGGAVELYHGRNKFESGVSQVFSTEESGTGVNVAFSPHLDINITDQFFIDLNPALMLLFYEFETRQTFNPALPVAAQKQGSFEFGSGGWVVQLGLGYKF